MTRDFCMFCGYMKNGHFIRPKSHQMTQLENGLGEDYYVRTRGDHSFLIFLFGPLYFCYRNHFFLGIFFQLLEFYLWIKAYVFMCYFLGPATYFLGFLFFLFLERVLCIMLLPPLNFYLLKKKIARINALPKEQQQAAFDRIKTKSLYQFLGAIFLFLFVTILGFCFLQWKDVIFSFFD